MNFLFKKKEPVNSYQALQSHEKVLFELIAQKNFDAFIQVMENEKININMKDQQGNTLLMHAVEDDSKLQFTEYILSLGADVNAVDDKKFTALFQASYWNSKETVKVLLTKKGINIDSENKAFGFVLNALTGTFFKDHYDVAKLLLYHGADPFKAEKIMLSQESVLKNVYSEKYQNLVDFYKRWRKNKLMILVAFHFSQNKKPNQKVQKNARPFDVGLLPKDVVKLIADNFL